MRCRIMQWKVISITSLSMQSSFVVSSSSLPTAEKCYVDPSTRVGFGANTSWMCVCACVCECSTFALLFIHDLCRENPDDVVDFNCEAGKTNGHTAYAWYIDLFRAELWVLLNCVQHYVGIPVQAGEAQWGTGIDDGTALCQARRNGSNRSPHDNSFSDFYKSFGNFTT